MCVYVVSPQLSKSSYLNSTVTVICNINRENSEKSCQVECSSKLLRSSVSTGYVDVSVPVSPPSLKEEQPCPFGPVVMGNMCMVGGFLVHKLFQQSQNQSI